MCCVSVNCSITSTTVVHFLRQTDIGLALRKHKVIYSISPTLFSLSHSLPRSLSLFAFLLCKQETGVSCIASTAVTCPFPFPSLNLLFENSFFPSIPISSISLAFLLFHLRPSLSSSPHPLSLSVFSFPQLFCCRFDRYD